MKLGGVRQDCPFIASTPATATHFFGFHDLCPWAPDDSALALLRIRDELARLPTRADVAEICLWHPTARRIEPIATSRSWNWQQGARLQWLPKAKGTVVYNDAVAGRGAACIHEVGKGEVARLAFNIYAIAADGRAALGLDFGRLGRLWPAYGYDLDGPDPEPLTDDDGIHLVDIARGTRTLIVSIARAAAFAASPTASDVPHFLSHPTFSPSGQRFCFLHRFMSADGALVSRLFVCECATGVLTLLADEKVSHFDWYDDDTIYVWTRRANPALARARRRGVLANPALLPLVRLARRLGPRFKQRLLSEAYYRIPIGDPGSARALAQGVLERDGHPMFAHDRRWMLTDTYPGRGRRQALILYDLHTGTRHDIAALWADPRFGDRDLKCDLHPRWNRANTLVAVDSTHTGTRQVHIIDVRAVIGQPVAHAA